jgi:hypothetical protein
MLSQPCSRRGTMLGLLSGAMGQLSRSEVVARHHKNKNKKREEALGRRECCPVPCNGSCCLPPYGWNTTDLTCGSTFFSRPANLT